MLVELSVVEQRYQAVLEVLEGASVVEVAAVTVWPADGARVAAPVCGRGRAGRVGGPFVAAGLVPASDAAGRWRRWWWAMRRAHPAWGPDRIRWQLARDGVEPVPSRSRVYRALMRHGLVDAAKRKRRREDYRRWERGRAMELWQMDVMGRVFLADGRQMKMVTGIDDHSRFVVCAGLWSGRLPGRWSAFG